MLKRAMNRIQSEKISVHFYFQPDAKSLDFSHGIIMSDDTTSQYLACGVCLLSVDMKLKGGGQENGNTVAKLTYGVTLGDSIMQHVLICG